MTITTTVGASEAKARLSELLERVAQGEVVTITRRGRLVAQLVPIEAGHGERAAPAVAGLRALRLRATLGGLDWRELRDSGRR